MNGGRRNNQKQQEWYSVDVRKPSNDNIVMIRVKKGSRNGYKHEEFPNRYYNNLDTWDYYKNEDITDWRYLTSSEENIINNRNYDEKSN